MSLDLGALIAHVGIEDVQFQRSYVRLVRQFADLGVKAGAAAGGTNRLDTSLSEAAAAGNAAATGLGRADQAMTEAGVSASTAAVATGRLKVATTEQGLAASKLAQAQLRQIAAQERLNVLQESGKATTRQLASAEASLIAANDRVALSTERVEKASGATGRSWQSTGRGLTITGAVIAAGFAVAGKAAIDFDAKMALVRTLAKASDSDMRQLRNAALTVGQAYGYSAGQVADAEAELVKAGVSVKDIMGGALTGALTLAAAGQTDVASATNTAAVAMTQFRLSGKDVPHIADLLAAGADKALGSVGDLSEALKYGGLAAAQAGMSIEDTVGVLAELAQSGQIGSTAGSQLAMMLRNLEKPTVGAAALMKQLGISVYDASGQMLPFSAIAGELHDKIGALPPAQRDAAIATLFTSRAVRAANVLMRDGAAVVEQWTAKVDASGFAALQASGKMDSLSGDATKLKAALQQALIGTGESAQGPLRGVVQDLTGVIDAWNGLPGPVRDGIEAFLAAGGAITLLGGAALIAVPKVAALDVALKEMSGGAVTAGGALKTLGKATVVAAVLVGLYEGAKALGDTLQDNTAPSVNQFTNALVSLRREGLSANGDILAFITDVAKMPNTFGLQAKMVTNLDTALAGMVTSGHLDTAKSDWLVLTQRLHAAGMTTAQITKLFPAFGRALSDSATSANVAGNGVDSYGNAVTKAAQQTQSATDAAKTYSDALHALADPLFAMNKAEQDLRDKQQALTAAVHKYGPASRQAHQAQLDMASSALDVVVASKDLTASVKDGTTSVSAARRQLNAWVAAGLLTAAQARAVATSFGGIIDKAAKVDSAVRRAGGGMKAAGHDIGISFAQGIAIGIADGSIGAEKQAILLARKAAAAARGKKGFNSGSPSKVGAAIGDEFPQGVALGIARSAHVSTTAAIRMAQSAIQATQSQLQSLRGSAASMSSGVASSLTGQFDLSNAPNLSAKGITSFLAYGAHATSQFGALERRLIARHLDPRLVQQLAALAANDPGAGIAAARNLLASGAAGIARDNRLERQIVRNDTRTGLAVSRQQFGGGIDRLVHKLGELQSEMHHLRNEVGTITREARLEQHKSTMRSHR